MAKRLLSILLLFLYIIPSIGIIGSVHYCGGEMAAIVLIPTDEHPCACGPSEPMENGCCDDKAFSFKIKDNHKNADTKLIVKQFVDHTFTNKLFSSENNIALILDKNEQCRMKEKEPPDKELIVLYQSFLI